MLPVQGSGLTEPDNVTNLLPWGGSCVIKQKQAVFVYYTRKRPQSHLFDDFAILFLGELGLQLSYLNFVGIDTVELKTAEDNDAQAPTEQKPDEEKQKLTHFTYLPFSFPGRETRPFLLECEYSSHHRYARRKHTYRLHL